MFNPFKKKKKYPPFTTLATFDKKDFYFFRVAQWDWLNNKMIYANDPHGPRVLTFDPWPQIIFLDANGQLTIAEYVFHTANKYTNEIPGDLDKTIIDELNKLLSYKLVALNDKQKQLPREIELPLSKWNK